MGRLPRWRPLTSCIRQGHKRNCRSICRAMQLSHAEVGFWEMLQCVIAVSACVYRLSMLAILPIAVMYMLVMGAIGARYNF